MSWCSQAYQPPFFYFCSYVFDCKKPRSPENITWTGILKKTEQKYDEYIARIGSRFNKLIADTTSRSRAPNLRTAAHTYREQEPELVLRAACLMVHFEAELKGMFTADAWEALMLEWRRGARDPDLLGHCRLLSKDFKLGDLRFVQQHQLADAIPAAHEEGDSLSAAQKAAKVSDFNLDYEQLKEEQKAR